MKKIIFFFLFLAILFVPRENVLAFDTVDPTTDFYVNDYANILDSDTRQYIQEHSVSLANKTGAQIVVVTVPNLDGASLEEYATKLFRKFGIGDSEKNNGLLLLLALEERKMRVEVGYGLEEILPDGKTGRFQDEYMIPYFKNDEFTTGMLNGYKAFFKEVAEYYNYDDITIEWVNDVITDSYNKPSYCINLNQNKDNLDICSKNRMHTINPSLILTKNNVYDIKSKIDNGSIIYVDENNIEMLKSIIDFANKKGFNIVYLDELLDERTCK